MPYTNESRPDGGGSRDTCRRGSTSEGLTQNSRPLQVSNFKPFVKNTLRGFFDLELPFGMILRDCMLCEKDDKRWIGWPAKPFDKKDGTKSWANIVDFVDNKSKYLLQDEVFPLVLAAMAEAGR
jgi:hypothetical protein